MKEKQIQTQIVQMSSTARAVEDILISLPQLQWYFIWHFIQLCLHKFFNMCLLLANILNAGYLEEKSLFIVLVRNKNLNRFRHPKI